MILPKIKLNDIALYYEIHGAGAPLLLIAGLGSDSLSWGGIVAKLSARFKVITFDNRGVGRSEVPEGGYTVGQMADDAIRLLEHLKIKKAHILGHSMGGYIAQEIAICHPERIERLILASTASVSSQRNNVLLLKFYKELQNGNDLEAWIREWTRWLFSPKFLARKRFIDAFIKNGVNYPYAQQTNGFKGQIEAIAAFDSRERLDKIKAKTLVIAGSEDVLILPKEAETLAKSISVSIFQCLKNTAHCMHIENRSLFLKRVSEFLLVPQNCHKDL